MATEPLRFPTCCWSSPNLVVTQDCNPLTDFDGDTAVTVADVLFVLSAFGEGC